MEIEHVTRYPALAVGLKPSARQGEARLRGLYRIMYSKTISPTASPVYRIHCLGMVHNLRFALDRLAGRCGGAWPLHTSPVVPCRGKLSRSRLRGHGDGPPLTLPRWGREPGSSPQRGEAGRGAERGERFSPQPSMRLRRTTPQ